MNNCPKCDARVRVLDCRDSGLYIRRVRYCPSCHYRFTTREIFYRELTARPVPRLAQEPEEATVPPPKLLH